MVSWRKQKLCFVKREWPTLGVLGVLLILCIVSATLIHGEINDHKNYDGAACMQGQATGLQLPTSGEQQDKASEDGEAGNGPANHEALATLAANCLAAQSNRIASDNLVLTGLMAMFSFIAVALSAVAVVVAIRVDRHRIDAPSADSSGPP